LGHSIRGGAAREFCSPPGSNHASKLTEERANVVASILCIDDDRRVLDLYKALLGAKGHTVLTAPDGPTGLAITRKYSINVVVLDFRMPGMDGNQVARVLMQEHPKLPVVIWSGFPHHIPESLKWFADVVLEKGDGPDTLLSAIDKLIGSETKKACARSTARTSGRLSA
jgi:DNA-binding NtrC family response regulator